MSRRAQKFTHLLVVSAALIFLATVAPASSQVKHHAKPKSRISAAQATKAALAKYPGKVIGKVALENEEGQWQYSVNVKSGKTLREVMVDAKSGKIASVEKTTAADERKEAAAEKKSKHGK